ncbi:MAG: nucleotidyltransferase family protein [Caldilineaceae bacterium]|nr:nucleotidyltransferase family protein [Caldilineaceae bacterium]
MNGIAPPPIAAVIAAAGFSRRMGRFKQLLPWGKRTVIQTVVENLHAAGAAPILCITGHRGDEVTAALDGSPARTLPSPHYATSEMLSSYQTGIAALENDSSPFTIHGSLSFSGALLALADQPHIPARVIRQVIGQARTTPDQIVVPSHEMRRGHPIYLPRRLWDELLALPLEASLRDLLNRHSADIVYVDVDTDAIRRDMDEWGEYEGLREEFDQKRSEV